MVSPIAPWPLSPDPGKFVNSVAISADGSRIAAGTFFHDYSSSKTTSTRRLSTPTGDGNWGEYGTYVWGADGTLLYSDRFVGWEGVYWVALSADGDTVASSGWKLGAPDYQGFVSAGDVGRGVTLLSWPLPQRGNVVSLNADGTALLAGADQGYLFVRVAGNVFGGPPQTFPLAATGDQVLVAALDTRGTTGLLVSYHGQVQVFTLTSGGSVLALESWQLPNSAYCHAGALSADGGWAFIGANDGNLYALEIAAFLASPGPIWSVLLPDGARTIYGVTCSANGARIGVGGNLPAAGLVAMYKNLGTEGALSWQDQTVQPPNGLAMDDAGLALAAADGHDSGGDFTLWNAIEGTQVWSYSTTAMCWPIMLSADARRVAAGSDDSCVYLFPGLSD